MFSALMDKGVIKHIVWGAGNCPRENVCMYMRVWGQGNYQNLEACFNNNRAPDIALNVNEKIIPVPYPSMQ